MGTFPGASKQRRDCLPTSWARRHNRNELRQWPICKYWKHWIPTYSLFTITSKFYNICLNTSAECSRDSSLSPNKSSPVCSVWDEFALLPTSLHPTLQAVPSHHSGVSCPALEVRAEPSVPGPQAPPTATGGSALGFGSQIPSTAAMGLVLSLWYFGGQQNFEEVESSSGSQVTEAQSCGKCWDLQLSAALSCLWTGRF